MNKLKREMCIACHRNSPPVTNQELKELLPQLEGWELVAEDGVRKLDRTFHFSDFEEALEFTNRIGELAEAEGHHPRLVTEWGRVQVTWWTHKIRNLHRNDFIMAAKTGALHQKRPADRHTPTG
jgi:4a-hydroxytetrahydrobiopterin dehydratase